MNDTHAVNPRDPNFISQCNARIIGEVIRDLGGGRLTGLVELNSRERLGAPAVVHVLHADRGRMLSWHVLGVRDRRERLPALQLPSRDTIRLGHRAVKCAGPSLAWAVRTSIAPVSAS